MNKPQNAKLPGWVFGLIAIGGLVASGIFLGIMSVEGLTPNNLIKAIGFGIVGLVMFIGIYRK
jgi:hypothetical protein